MTESRGIWMGSRYEPPVLRGRELGVEPGCYSIMQPPLDIEAIFPITDAASAALMAIKADCLRKAGVISDQEKQRVDARVRTFLHEAALKDAA